MPVVYEDEYILKFFIKSKIRLAGAQSKSLKKTQLFRKNMEELGRVKLHFLYKK